MKENPEFSEKVIDLLTDGLGMTKEEVVTRMQKPWGLLQAMKGEWPSYRLDKDRIAVEDRLLAALAIVKYADEFGRKDSQKVRDILRQLIMDIDGKHGELDIM